MEVNSFAGAGYRVSEVVRILRKFKRKATAGQIPEGKHGIIYIMSKGLFREGGNSLKQLILKLESKIQQYGNIIAVVIDVGHGKCDDGQWAYSNSVIALKNNTGNTVLIVYVPNTAFKGHLPSAVRQKICESLTLSIDSQCLPFGATPPSSNDIESPLL